MGFKVGTAKSQMSHLGTDSMLQNSFLANLLYCRTIQNLVPEYLEYYKDQKDKFSPIQRVYVFFYVYTGAIKTEQGTGK